MKEVDLPEIETDSGCLQPVLPENGFIRVSILTITFDLEIKKNRTLNLISEKKELESMNLGLVHWLKW
jgi:hypothetical protein